MSSPQRVQILWVGSNGQTYHITLDATEREQHGLPSEVTDHPVEDGVNFSDHIRALPDTLQLTAQVSNTPIFLPPTATAGIEVGFDGARSAFIEIQGPPRTLGNTFGRQLPVVGALLAPVPVGMPPESAVVQGYDVPFDRVQAVFAALRTIREEGRIVTIITTLREYQSMALQNIDITRDAKTGNALALSITAKLIRIGRTELVTVPAIPTGRKDEGKKTTTPVKQEDAPTQAESFMHAVVRH